MTTLHKEKGPNILLNGSAGAGLDNWTTSGGTTPLGGVDGANYFQIAPTGYIEQSIGVTAFLLTPEELFFDLHLLVPGRADVDTYAEVVVDIVLTYADLIENHFTIPFTEGLTESQVKTEGTWYKAARSCSLRTNAALNNITFRVRNFGPSPIGVDAINLYRYLTTLELHETDDSPHRLPLAITVNQEGIKAVKGSDVEFWLKDDGSALFTGTVGIGAIHEDGSVITSLKMLDPGQDNDLNLADLAFEDVLELAKLGNTVVYDGYLQTILINADFIQAGTIDAGIVNVVNLNADNIVAGTLDVTQVSMTGYYAPSTANAMSSLSITSWNDLPGAIDTMQKVIDNTDEYTDTFTWKDQEGLRARHPGFPENYYWQFDHHGLRYTQNNGSSWYNELNKDGTLKLGNGAFLWDGLTLSITGAINVTGGNAATQAYADGKVNSLQNTLGDLAYEDLVQVAKLGTTIIDGGYIRTTLIEVGAINITGLNGAATFTAYDTTNVDGVAAGTVKNNSATGANHAGTVHAPSNATEGADWNNNLNNIPGTIGAPSGTGLFLTPTYMGFYTGGAWKTFIKNDGNFAFAGDGNNYVSWNGTTLEIAGELMAATGTFSGELQAATGTFTGELSAVTGIFTVLGCGTFENDSVIDPPEDAIRIDYDPWDETPRFQLWKDDYLRIEILNDIMTFYNAVGETTGTFEAYEIGTTERDALFIASHDGPIYFRVYEPGEALRGFYFEFGPIWYVDHPTTAVAANTSIIFSSGQIARSTSAQKYKTDIEPLELEYAQRFLDNCDPIFYRSLCEIDNKEYSYYGYNADEIGKVEPRLVDFNDEGGAEGFAYDRVGALLHVIVKEHERKIKLLEEKFNGESASRS